MAPPAEISIPTTCLSSVTDSKPYTLYNITLRLPLRSFVVQKRYSDFTALHQTLTHLVGAAPPAPLPGKSWFKSTISSPELTEDRRLGLEKYLRAIAESPDRRWRDTPAWRAFLNLPSSSTTNSAASASGIGIDGRVPAIGLPGANTAAAADPGTWLDLHRELKAALHEARLCLARRDAALENGQGKGNSAALEAGAAAKRALVKAGSLLPSLNEGLRAMSESKRVGEGELRRRRDLISAARSERDGLEKLSASLASTRGASAREGMPNAGDKSALLAGGSSSGPRAGGRVLGAPLAETERTRELGNDGVLQLQRQQMEEQDQDVEALTRIVRRQKEMGLAIKEEVDRQTEMLDQMNADVDRVSGKVKVAKDRTRRLG
ncbi:putative snare complex subunit protein [Phaeoacremonium minimum UCRPA7]|uniref:Putative snare complex subunit protein n=1 Tax=Phaeoacremonium minimum (strain UCR-PA7) TaxID=1286976 RepID=R8BEV9_PHAM7|nr:putative snare complex subunit protein [Phaeoacremonium minimum UCRPA7]EON97838.1 putative snare complex subunit protein [Phaeoacremonium minimum UCRPA7]